MYNKTIKEKYQVPQIEIIQMENEGGVMSASAGGIDDGGGAFSSPAKRSSSNTQQSPSSLQDLEDLINDILTY